MFFGYDMEKFLLLLLVAALLIGPERLPRYAEGLAKLTVRVREWLSGARTRVKEEMGDDFDEVEWRKLDPRQYDPRRIIRDALFEEPQPTTPAVATATIAEPVAPRTAPPVFDGTKRPPFDSEAT